MHKVSSARVAETAKLLENTYRSVNIALVNEMAQLHHPDIVLLNGDLTTSDALEIARVLRSNIATVGIIILTLFPDEERLFQCIKVGANAYITRPISPEALVETIRRVNSGEFLFSFYSS